MLVWHHALPLVIPRACLPYSGFDPDARNFPGIRRVYSPSSSGGQASVYAKAASTVPKIGATQFTQCIPSVRVRPRARGSRRTGSFGISSRHCRSAEPLTGRNGPDVYRAADTESNGRCVAENRAARRRLFS